MTLYPLFRVLVQNHVLIKFHRRDAEVAEKKLTLRVKKRESFSGAQQNPLRSLRLCGAKQKEISQNSIFNTGRKIRFECPMRINTDFDVDNRI